MAMLYDMVISNKYTLQNFILKDLRHQNPLYDYNMYVNEHCTNKST